MHPKEIALDQVLHTGQQQLHIAVWYYAQIQEILLIEQMGRGELVLALLIQLRGQLLRAAPRGGHDDCSESPI